MLSRSGLTKMSISLVARGWAWTLTAQPPIIRYLTLQARKADRRSQKLPSNFSFIAALLEKSKAEFLHGHQPFERRPALPERLVAMQELSFAFFEERGNEAEIRRQFLRSPVCLPRL